MKILDRYIIKQYILTFVFAILALSSIIMAIHYSENIRNILSNKAELGEIIVYFLYFTPNLVALMYHLFIFISTIFFTSKLAYRSEFIAMGATGMNILRILKPYVIGAVIISSCSLLLNHILIPRSNKLVYNFEEKYIRATVKKGAENNIHVRLSPNTYVYVQKFYLSTNKGERFTEETVEGNLLKEKLMADNIQYIDSTDTWLLKNVTIRKFDGLQETLDKYPTMTKKYNLRPKDFTEDLQRISTLTSMEIYEKTALNMSRGLENLNAYSYEMHRRTADAFAGIILTIIAVCIASRKIRGGSGLHLALGIILGAFFLLFIKLGNTYAINSGMNALLASWIPNMIFSVIALLMVRWRMQ